ncbi:Ohr family peroxiredoxin [Tuanshanicoccus lijuaniae]|uniref:Ohr family peroxiredoxin n=1 Tax=Aerococcaceae bacterium zg-1292 TaxID=2774330 RepID=UPI001938DC08|nr:Ohr family peroxiredoxin [Aerococcaceae bacterium zg-1292]MBF6625090.1 Ohr family peroxiredoxin [Aerococcaceae bacterium zg-BR9]MBS4456437.1 Ohr family peroxiredoxin [Aerococcaceae bacterium zg-A91]MBS4458287.1 Ohr family peroxiredoxin [Aerococcaceae bacterium zg-BR33]QQA37481.1 Ohr family peroxiredoxin [Aerococcaceae bacterium zg-1292]
MKKIHTTKMINTGGRVGEVHSPDKTMNFQVVQPGQKVAGATNPEQLFAAGYSACFNGALGAVMKERNIDGEAVISATVSLYAVSERSLPDVKLGVAIEGAIEGVDLETAQALLEEAHQVCPYSRAVDGNIEVTVKAVESI